MSLNLYKACSLLKNNVKIVNPFANCSYPENTLIQREKNGLMGALMKVFYLMEHIKGFYML